MLSTISSENWPLDIEVDIFHAEGSTTSPSDNNPFPPELQDGNETWLKEKRQETQNLRSSSWPDMKEKVKSVLEFMNQQEINLPLFLDAFSWGHDDCRDDTIISHARAQFLFSDELPGILERWWMPPKSRHNTRRPEGAKKAFEKVALSSISGAVNEELEAATEFLKSTSKKVSSAELKVTSYEGLICQMQEKMPIMWSLLSTCTLGLKIRSGRNTGKSDRVVMTVLAMLTYTRKQTANHLQRLFAIYFKFHGLSAKAFDTLHSLGIAMSMKWTTNCVSDLANGAKEELLSLLNNCLWVMSHDNINIAFKVYSQRINNQTHFDSGTAATIFIKPDEEPIPIDWPEKLRRKRAEGLQKPLSARDLVMLEINAAKALKPFVLYEILKVLMDAPESQLSTYYFQKSDLLKPPEPIYQLPYGPEHSVRQFLLNTVKMEEASYEGNNRLISEWLQQLKLHTPKEKIRTAEERIIFFIGDQLTADRLKKLSLMRAGDYNSFYRYDYLQPVAGWLHTMMAYSNSLHEQYLGTTADRGLHHAMTLLKRKGLLRSLTKGPFYHDIRELLLHVLQAHIRLCWKTVLGNDDLSQMHSRTPAELLALAEEIYNKYMSSRALAALDTDKDGETYDEVKYKTTMMLRDLLHYLLLDRAIKQGDAGIMKHMIPHLLFRFHGGSNPKYAIEMMDLLQGFNREWPEEIGNHILRHTWLINFQGKADTFLAIDMAQEHNIRDIKDTYRPDGPNSDWKYLNKISPAIPAIKAIAAHVEDESGVLSRGKKHGSPNTLADLLLLERSFALSNLHVNTADREMPDEKDNKGDFYSDGMTSIQRDNFLENWHKGRNYKRNTEEIFDDLVEGCEIDDTDYAMGVENEEEGGAALLAETHEEEDCEDGMQLEVEHE